MKLPRLKPSHLRITSSGLVNTVGVVIIAYLVVVLGQTVKHNYDLNRQITALQGQINLLQDQKSQLAYSLQYYKTDSFRDREARSKLGLQLPDEHVVVIPHPAPADSKPAVTPTHTPVHRSNFLQWFDFLAGRNS